MQEPGLDLHEWESTWADLDEAAKDDPEETLPEMVRLLQEMLDERGFDLDEPVTAEGEEPAMLRTFVAARDLARRLDAGLDVEREDLDQAIDDLRDVHDYLVGDRPAP
jgi:hypothetical protein